MSYTFEKHVSSRRATLTATDENGSVVLKCDIHPIELYKDMRLNFREEMVPCRIDLYVNNTRCSANMVDSTELHDAFFQTIFEFLLFDSTNMLLLNVLDETLYNFYLQNAPLMKERFVDQPENKKCSWLNHEQSQSLINSWNVDFAFHELPECKLMIVYKDSKFSQYQDASWIKRRTELANGVYL